MRPIPRPPLRWTLLAAVGLLAAAVPALLALEAARASRRHREAAERALHDHATFAATTFRQRAIARVFMAVGAVLRPVGNARLSHPEGPLPDLALLRRASAGAQACRDCGPAFRPLYFFRVITADSSLQLDGPPQPLVRRDWLARDVATLGELGRYRDWDYASVIDTLGARPQVVYLTVRRGADGLPRAVYGFAVDLAELTDGMLAPILADAPLLPVPVSGAPRNDSLLSVALVEPRGRRVAHLSRARDGSPYAASIPGGLFLGGWNIRVALDPRTAPPMLIGGLPPSRTGLLVTLVLITAALIAGTVSVAWRALELARLRAAFVASVSHELRTPLAQILLFGETLTLGRMQSPRDVRDAGRIIVGEARRLLQLVENVLLLGRDGSAAPSRALVPEPLAPLVREVVDGFAPLASAAEVRLRADGLADIVAPVERDGVRQMLLNLLDNAVKYGPPGQTVTVGLTMVDGRALLSVEDEGPGIPPADRERVWRPFVRLPRDVETHVAGSGIGLAVVRDLVARHGGRARVEAGAAGGARVVVELPGAVAAADGAAARSDACVS